MSKIGHNSGKRIVELDEELLEFAIKNCESNLFFGTNALSVFMKTEDRAGAEKLVDLIENFKALKKAFEKAT